MDKTELTKLLKNKAYNFGFSNIGICDSEPLIQEGEYLKNWINNKYHAEMKWFENSIQKRINPKEIFPEIKSIIVLALNYYNNVKYNDDNEHAKISRYALGVDYHIVFKEKLKPFIGFIATMVPQLTYRVFVDTGPILEKSLAQKSGIGWIGKNSNLIDKQTGSWIFLGVILTNLDLDFDSPAKNRCGTCEKCIKACPTSAIVNPYVIDARKCISYLTIEHRGSVFPDNFRSKFINWIFGCDICQEVCPWNRFSTNTSLMEFMPKIDNSPDYNELKQMDESKFINIYKKTPVKRAKYKGLLRNFTFALNEKKD